jgi:hypothetical protein
LSETGLKAKAVVNAKGKVVASAAFPDSSEAETRVDVEVDEELELDDLIDTTAP